MQKGRVRQVRLRSRLGHEISFGIGIAHGFAALGTTGFEGRFDYSAIGTISHGGSTDASAVDLYAIVRQPMRLPRQVVEPRFREDLSE